MDRRACRGVVAAVVALGLFACAGTAGRDGVGAGEGTETTYWSFVLLAGPDTLWVLEETRSAQPGWVALRGPNGSNRSVSLRERCEVPECGVEAAVCGMAIPAVARIAPGDSIVWSWDGLTSSLETRTGSTCEVRVPAAPGRYIVEACWTDRAPVPGETPLEPPILDESRCETRRVDVPGSGRIVWGG